MFDSFYIAVTWLEMWRSFAAVMRLPWPLWNAASSSFVIKTISAFNQSCGSLAIRWNFTIHMHRSTIPHFHHLSPSWQHISRHRAFVRVQLCSWCQMEQCWHAARRYISVQRRLCLSARWLTGSILTRWTLATSNGHLLTARCNDCAQRCRYIWDRAAIATGARQLLLAHSFCQCPANCCCCYCRLHAVSPPPHWRHFSRPY